MRPTERSAGARWAVHSRRGDDADRRALDAGLPGAGALKGPRVEAPDRDCPCDRAEARGRATARSHRRGPGQVL